MKLTGSEILLECLRQEGVDTIFGFPGGAVLDIYNQLVESSLHHILCRHEQAVVHAADGYARATGKVGVGLATSGPGATNTVTGLATAYADSTPMVVITGQVPTPLIGNDAFQEADVVGITRPCTKHNYLVNDIRELPRIIKEAFYIARTGRPGPVLIDLPKDIQQQSMAFSYPAKVDLRGYKPTVQGNPRQIQKAAKMLLAAKRPLLYVGGGAVLANASEQLQQLAEATGIPVTTTLMAMSAFPSEHPQSLGMLGMHGTYAANMAVTNCDLLFSIGARFDDRVTGKIATFAPNAKIIHADVDPTSIKKNVRVDLPIVGDLGAVLTDLVARMKELEPECGELKAVQKPWHDELHHWKESRPLTYESSDDVIKPQCVIERLRALTEDATVVTTDVGQHQMWAAQFFNFRKERTFLTSGGLGTMGFGVPAALGAAAGVDGPVIAITGDGSFQMNSQELATLVQFQLPVKIALLNNNYLGMVRQWQQLFYDRRYSHVEMDLPIDFVKLAEAYGACGLKAEKPDQVDAVIRKALETPGPVLMEFRVSQEENVMPIVPPGASLDEMVLS